MEGLTLKALIARGEKQIEPERLDPVSGASFCGPLSVLENEWRPSELGKLGFPNGEIGNVTLFDSQAEAAAQCFYTGDHIAIDLPAPLAALRWKVLRYSAWDGGRSVLHECADYMVAEGHLSRARVKYANDQYSKCWLDCYFDNGALGEHRPTLEQGEALERRARALRSRESAA
jgi:hypothetical protein